MTRNPRWFAFRFIAFILAGNVLMLVPAVDAWVISPWTSLNTVASAKLASVVGLPAQANGSVLSTDAAAINVMQGCNGFHAVLIYSSAVLASPVSWTARLSGVIAGSVVILGFNLVRLVNLLAVARYVPSRLELFHVYIWQTLIVIFALATFIGWGVLIARRRTPNPQSSPG